MKKIIMVKPKKRYTNKFVYTLSVPPIYFLGGAFLTLFVVGVVVWGTQWDTWIYFEHRINSLISIGIIYSLTFASIQRFSVYIAENSLRYIIFSLILWSSLVLGILFVLRVLYSVYFLFFSCLTMLIFFSFIEYLKNQYSQQIIAYIPTGRVENLPKLSSVTWQKLNDATPIDKQNVDIVMADLRAGLSGRWELFLAQCSLKQIPVYHSGRLIEQLSGRVKIDHLYENELGSLLPSGTYLIIKRILDIILILVSLPVLLPILVITGLLIIIETPGGAFFSQERIGMGGHSFTMYKFRSMYLDTASDKETLEADTRVTRVGRIIRRMRIDELPQFYNVLKGEMSLIGPRPEFRKFAEEYRKAIPFYDYRHIVKPGISGWAQVVQGYNFGVDDTKIKLEYDFYYIKNFSFSLDLLIFFKTIQTMLTGFGAR